MAGVLWLKMTHTLKEHITYSSKSGTLSPSGFINVEYLVSLSRGAPFYTFLQWWTTMTIERYRKVCPMICWFPAQARCKIVSNCYRSRLRTTAVATSKFGQLIDASFRRFYFFNLFQLHLRNNTNLTNVNLISFKNTLYQVITKTRPSRPTAG